MNDTPGEFPSIEPESQTWDEIALVGLGLLGGSIAMAARQLGLARRVVAVGRRRYEDALARGIVDESKTDLEAAAATADLIILCTPVEIIRSQLPQVMKHARNGAIITDVGSTKERLVRMGESLDSNAHFVGSHPMVGSHLTGWQHGSPDLFKHGLVYITVTPHSDLGAVARLGSFWENLGAYTVYTDPARHDELCALVSHVPHMTAVSLMRLLGLSGEDPHLLRLVSGKGLRDTTRIAMGSADVWSEICDHNGPKIADRLEELAGLIKKLSERIRSGDESIHRDFENAAELRRKLQPLSEHPESPG